MRARYQNENHHRLQGEVLKYMKEVLKYMKYENLHRQVQRCFVMAVDNNKTIEFSI